MHSLMKKFAVRTGKDRIHMITITAMRMSNDINGNPRHKIHVWSNSGTIWSPTVKGYRRSKDDSYVLKSTYNLEESMEQFVKVFEESIND